MRGQENRRVIVDGYNFFFLRVIYCIFGCTGSPVLHSAFSSCSERGRSLVVVHRCGALWWLHL